MLEPHFLDDSKEIEEKKKWEEWTEEGNKNESLQWTGIIILRCYLIGFLGIYNTGIQLPVSFSVLQQ